MLRCRSCVRNHLSSLISIHSPAATVVRPFTASAIVSTGRRIRHSTRSETSPKRSDARRPSGGSGGKSRPSNFARVPLPRFGGDSQGETRDPVKLAARVEEYLAVNDVARAHRVVELAASKIGTVVSWNRLIVHSMKTHNVKRAFRFYNDVITSLALSPSRSDTPTLSHTLVHSHALASPPVTPPL